MTKSSTIFTGGTSSDVNVKSVVETAAIVQSSTAKLVVTGTCVSTTCEETLVTVPLVMVVTWVAKVGTVTTVGCKAFPVAWSIAPSVRLVAYAIGTPVEPTLALVVLEVVLRELELVVLIELLVVDVVDSLVVDEVLLDDNEVLVDEVVDSLVVDNVLLDDNEVLVDEVVDSLVVDNVLLVDNEVLVDEVVNSLVVDEVLLVDNEELDEVEVEVVVAEEVDSLLVDKLEVVSLVVEAVLLVDNVLDEVEVVTVSLVDSEESDEVPLDNGVVSLVVDMELVVDIEVVD